MGFVIGHLPLIIMLGSIIGDIVGSRYEFANIHTTDFELFTPYNDFTDDTICTIAIADALLHGKSFKDSLLYWCRRYPSPMGSYGGRFGQWIRSENPQPYNSFGNGSAMRVAPCGWLGSMEQVLSLLGRVPNVLTTILKGSRVLSVSLMLLLWLLKENPRSR